MTTCIVKLKDNFTIADAAQEVWEVFGKGGHPDAGQVEDFIGWVNTPVVNGYFRALFDNEYIQALQYIKEIDAADSVEIVSVEVDGQDDFIIHTEYDGDVLLAKIAGFPLKH